MDVSQRLGEYYIINPMLAENAIKTYEANQKRFSVEREIESRKIRKDEAYISNLTSDERLLMESEMHDINWKASNITSPVSPSSVLTNRYYRNLHDQWNSMHSKENEIMGPFMKPDSDNTGVMGSSSIQAKLKNLSPLGSAASEPGSGSTVNNICDIMR